MYKKDWLQPGKYSSDNRFPAHFSRHAVCVPSNPYEEEGGDLRSKEEAYDEREVKGKREKKFPSPTD